MADHLADVKAALLVRITAVLPSFTQTDGYESKARWGELKKPHALVFNPVASAEELPGRQNEITTDVSVILLRAKADAAQLLTDLEALRDDVISTDTLGSTVDRTLVPEWGIDSTNDGWEAAAMIVRGIEVD